MRLILELAAGKSNALEIMIPALGHLGNAAILRGFKNVASASFLLNLKPQEGWFIHLFIIERVLLFTRNLMRCKLKTQLSGPLGGRCAVGTTMHMQEPPWGHTDGDW